MQDSKFFFTILYTEDCFLFDYLSSSKEKILPRYKNNETEITDFMEVIANYHWSS